jgi:hypothetical protein
MADTFVVSNTSFLLYNQRLDNIEHTGRGFKVHGKSMRGCIHRLQQSFYPDFDIRYVRPKKRKRDAGVSGRDRGRRVDEEITALVNGTSGDNTDLHNYTKKWITATRHWKWTPVAAQLKIYDEDTQIATAIDCVCKDEEGKLIFVEVKTGFEDYVDNSTHFMHTPLGNVRNTPQNQHFLQLLIMCIIMEKYYWTNEYSAFVVRIDEKGVRREALPSWAHDLKDAIYSILVEHTKQKKRHDRVNNGDIKKGL